MAGWSKVDWSMAPAWAQWWYVHLLTPQGEEPYLQGTWLGEDPPNDGFAVTTQGPAPDFEYQGDPATSMTRRPG